VGDDGIGPDGGFIADGEGTDHDGSWADVDPIADDRAAGPWCAAFQAKCDMLGEVAVGADAAASVNDDAEGMWHVETGADIGGEVKADTEFE
jgi:hypothetical protein